MYQTALHRDLVCPRHSSPHSQSSVTDEKSWCVFEEARGGNRRQESARRAANIAPLLCGRPFVPRKNLRAESGSKSGTPA
jgi:hypothetical protein